jgi:hypothetical protein
MTTLLSRFLRYVKIRHPVRRDQFDLSQSRPRQLTLSRMLADECKSLGLADVYL